MLSLLVNQNKLLVKVVSILTGGTGKLNSYIIFTEGCLFFFSINIFPSKQLVSFINLYSYLVISIFSIYKLVWSIRHVLYMSVFGAVFVLIEYEAMIPSF